MTTVVLDSHVIHWWSAEPERISADATRAIGEADELAVADISWFELAWLARHERIVVAIPNRRPGLQQLAAQTANDRRLVRRSRHRVGLPSSFPGDPPTGSSTRRRLEWLVLVDEGPSASRSSPRHARVARRRRRERLTAYAASAGRMVKVPPWSGATARKARSSNVSDPGRAVTLRPARPVRRRPGPGAGRDTARRRPEPDRSRPG